MRHETEIKYIIHLLECSLSDLTPENPSEDIDWNIFNLLVFEQRIASTLYFSMSKLPPEILSENPQWESYILAYKHCLVDDSNRSYETEQLKEIFRKKHIDFVLLKGSVTKYLYADSVMRPMSDIDILYRNASLEDITNLFTSFGYTIKKTDPGEISFYKSTNSVKIEMQQELVDRGYIRWYQYLRNCWEQFIKKSEHEYVMSDEDFYIYHIIHMGKHFRNGGIGISQLLDVYIMNQSFPSLDFPLINQRLETLGLRKFHDNLQLLLNVWFQHEKVSAYDYETVMMLTEYIFRNGAFGKKSQVEINVTVGNNRDKISLIKKIFPDYNMMNSYYGGALSRFPWLLPFYWIRINIKRIFCSGKDSRKIYHSISKVSDRRISKTKELMKRCNFDMNI